MINKKNKKFVKISFPRQINDLNFVEKLHIFVQFNIVDDNIY
ncbi:MAG: hypothetical protein PHP82_01710 [Candidatus ainarchaeum sp.]|nr:hypothetical protein [Candidatus ainarchaeum sp.]